jgi:hypothetical protein
MLPPTIQGIDGGLDSPQGLLHVGTQGCLAVCFAEQRSDYEPSECGDRLDYGVRLVVSPFSVQRATTHESVGVGVIHLMNTARFTGHPPYSIPPYSSRGLAFERFCEQV